MRTMASVDAMAEFAVKISPRSRQGRHPVLDAIRQLDVGQTLVIEPNEWNGGKLHTRLNTIGKAMTRRFSGKRLTDGGWLVSRVE